MILQKLTIFEKKSTCIWLFKWFIFQPFIYNSIYEKHSRTDNIVALVFK